MTDWDAFCYIAARLLKRYSDKDVKRCLVYLDAGILDSLSARDALSMLVGITQFQWGRDLILAPLFHKVKERNPDLFLSVEPKICDTFNALMRRLFSQKVASDLLVAVKVQKMAPKEQEKVQEAPRINSHALVDTFANELRGVPAYLASRHVEGFLRELEEKHIDESEIPELLHKQKEHVFAIDRFLRQQSDSTKVKTGPFIQKLYGSDLAVYTDVPIEANRLIMQSFVGESIDGPILTDELVEQYKKQIIDFHEGILQSLEKLVEKAKSRGQKIDEIALFIRAFSSVSSPLKAFKDLHAEYQALEEQVHKLHLSKQDLVTGTFSENEEKLKKAYDHYLELKSSMPKTMDRLHKRALESEERAQDEKSAIKRRLFEIFWNISPYQDLLESFQDMRKMLTSQLVDAMQKFYTGTSTSRGFLEVCQEMPYEHDVVKLRNEITHRSSRLKDLRDEAIRLYRDVLNTRRLLEVAGLEQDKVHNDFILFQEVVRQIVEDVENPFKAFSKAETKDDINYVFRSFWIRIEEIQPQIEHGMDVAEGLLQKAAVTLKKAFLQALDTLEEVVSQKVGTRKQLVVPVERDLQVAQDVELYNAIIRHMHAVEKSYSFCQPFSFFMQIQDHKTRLQMMQEALTLDSHIEAMWQFAKAMQYVKTFEEERVDTILEAFEHQHLVEDDKGWSLYIERMHRAARLVEDEIFLDIGLLDRHALMDVDPVELNKTLVLAATRAKEHIFEPKYGLLATLGHSHPVGPLCVKTLQDLQDGLVAWSKVAVDATQPTDAILEHLRSYCHYLFDTKVLLGSNANMLLPKCLEFINELRSLQGYIEGLLQKKRLQHQAEWGTPWIPECHNMRSLIECFEPEAERDDALQPLMKKVFAAFEQIPEHKEISLDKELNELNMHLEEIKACALIPKKDHPFIYIPGYLAFFDVRKQD